MKCQKTDCMLSLLFVCTSLVLLFPALSHAQNKDSYLLQYKFKKGEQLQYKTERCDSTQTSSETQTAPQQVMRWSLQTLSVLETPTETTYKVSIKTDSVWTDQDQAGTSAESESGRRMVFRQRGPEGPGERGRSQEFEIGTDGQSVTDDPVTSPFLLTLPKNPVAVNDTWEFEKNIQRTGRMKSTTRITGQCLLYNIQKQSSPPLALIIVNTQSTGQSEFKFKRPDQNVEISGATQSKGSGTSLVYFDIDRGRITEIVSEDKTESMSESSRGSYASSSSSKSTVKLISK